MIQQLSKNQNHAINLDYIVNSTLNRFVVKKEEELLGAVYDAGNWMNEQQFLSYMEEASAEETEEKTFSRKIKSLEDGLDTLSKQGYAMQYLCMEDYSVAAYSRAGESEQNSASLTQRIEAIKKAPDNMYLNSLQNSSAITINSLYESIYKGSYKKTELTAGLEQVQQVLQLNNLSNTEGNMWAVQLLIDYEMEVTKENAVKLQNIRDQVNGLSEGETADSGDKALVENNQVCYDKEAVNQITDKLGMVTDEHIQKLVEEKQEVTIGNLKEMIYKNTQTVLGENPQQSGEQEPLEAPEETQEIQEQIKQIRLKLTAEAAQKISEKMPLESSRLSEVVSELNALEEERIEEISKQLHVEFTQEEKRQIKDVVETTQYMKFYPEVTVDMELKSQEELSLKQLHEGLLSYSQNETQVEASLGDSARKVEGQIEALLMQNEVEVSQETIQAAKALIANEVEVNQQTLQEVGELTVKIDHFLTEMTPLRAASLIKEGKNIYEASVDELLIEMAPESAEQLKTSVAEAMVALEKEGQINEQQKESMLGLYRILQSVSRQQEEVAGYLYRNELPVTLKRLQEAARYVSQNNQIIDRTVDDETGEIEQVINDRLTAQEMLEAGRKQAVKTSQLLAKIENMAVSSLREDASRIQKITALLYPCIKQEFKKQFESFKGLSTLPDSFLERLEEIKEMDSQSVTAMLDKGIEPTVSNLYWFNEMKEKSEKVLSVWENLKQLSEEEAESLEEIKWQLEEAEKNADKAAEAAVLSGEMEKYRFYKDIQEMAGVQKQLAKQEVFYQIPLQVNGEQKLFNMYVNKDGKNGRLGNTENKLIVMQYETQHLGKIEVQINISGKHIDYKLKAEGEETLNKIRQQNNRLLQNLEEMGCSTGKSEFESSTKQDHSLTGLIKSGENTFEEVI